MKKTKVQALMRGETDKASPQAIAICGQMLDALFESRDKLADALALGANPQDADMANFIQALHHDRKSNIMSLALSGRISGNAIATAYKRGVQAKIGILVQQNLEEHAPTVARHTVEDALSRDLPCATCNATGVLKDGTMCSVCRGTKVERVHGNAADRKAALEMAGLLGKGKDATEVNTQVNVVSLPSFEDTVRHRTITVEAVEKE